MEIIFELLLQFLLELFIQGSFELGFRGIVKIFDSGGAAENPWLAICGYVLMGFTAAAISIWLFPLHVLKPPAMQILNLAVTPILLGFLFEFFGRWKAKHEKPRHMVDRFSYGFTFALTMGLVRFLLAA